MTPRHLLRSLNWRQLLPRQRLRNRKEQNKGNTKNAKVPSNHVRVDSTNDHRSRLREGLAIGGTPNGVNKNRPSPAWAINSFSCGTQIRWVEPDYFRVAGKPPITLLDEVAPTIFYSRGQRIVLPPAL